MPLLLLLGRARLLDGQLPGGQSAAATLARADALRPDDYRILFLRALAEPQPEARRTLLRRANLLVSDIDFADARGKILHIGTVRIRIYGETRPCEQMETVAPGLQQAMSVPWGGGAFGEVLDDGEIAVGDAVELLR